MFLCGEVCPSPQRYIPLWYFKHTKAVIQMAVALNPSPSDQLGTRAELRTTDPASAQLCSPALREKCLTILHTQTI